MKPDIKELPIPLMETPAEYAGLQCGLYNVTTWLDLCAEYGISVAESQSGKVAFSRAVERAKKGTGESPVKKLPVYTEYTNSTNVSDDASELLKRAFELLAPKTAALDETRVLELIKQNQTYKGISLRVENKEDRKLEGIFHKSFDSVLQYMMLDFNIYLYGPAGTGKTQIAEQIADALGLQYSAISVCGQSSKIDFLGYMDANGNYVQTEFRRIYETGGVFLIDEVDNGNPNILAVLNAALANGQMAFPDGMIKMHTEFKCIAAANTFGTGPTEAFIGRNPIDAATQNRFMKVFVGYDNQMEELLFGSQACTLVNKYRKALDGQTGWVLSMRDISRVSKLFNIGFSKSEVIQVAIKDQLAPQFHGFIYE